MHIIHSTIVPAVSGYVVCVRTKSFPLEVEVDNLLYSLSTLK